MEAMNCSEAFSLLKPMCVKIFKSPCKDDLQELSNIFSKFPRKTLTDLQDYVLYPLEINLQRPDIRLETKRYILDCMRNLIDNTGIKDVKKFFYLFTLIFLQIYDEKSKDMVADVSEELKLSVVHCAQVLIVNCNDDVVGQIYEKNNLPKISQGIFICMQLMQTEKMKSLRIAAIEFIMAITRTDDLKRDVDVWRPNIADTFMFLVPGVLSGLHKVAIGDDKQAHNITVMALRSWGRILVLILEDITPQDFANSKISFSAKVTEKLDKINSRRKSERVSEGSRKDSSKSILDTIKSQQRTFEWAENVSENVLKFAESFKMLQNHNHLKVRLELVNTCHLVLRSCHKHFKGGSIVFVEILLNLCDDNSNEVSAASEKALKEISSILPQESGISLYEILEENFYNLMSKLPRIIRVESDGDKLSTLCLLKQYLQLLGSQNLPRLMQSSSHIQRTVEALLQIVQMESSSLSLLEDCSLRDLELKKDIGFLTPWINFTHFSDTNIKEKLEEVLRLLGENGDLEILCNYFLDLLCSDVQNRNEIIFVLNHIMIGGSHNTQYEHLVKNMLDVYFSTGMWCAPVTVTPSVGQVGLSSEAIVNASQARSNLQLLCLLVEGVGKVATALGQRFSVFLMRCLYPVVERAGSAHEALCAAGLRTASAIAKAVNQGEDITSLLAANMDYFMVQVSLRLRNLRSDPSVLNVLTVAMQHSNKNMLPHLQNAVSDILLQSCDNFQMRHTSSFLHVFYIFFVCIRKWFPRNTKISNISSEMPHNFNTVELFLKYLHDSHICRQDDLEPNEDAINDSNIISSEDSQYSKDMLNLEEEQSNEKSDVPSHIKITVSIVQRCLHLLPSKDKQHQLQVIEALTEGLQVLADYEDELLPIVHQVWSPLVGRLQDGSDCLLLNRSFSLLCLLAELARDFIRTRTLKQVWTQLCKCLTNSAEKSKNKDSGSAFRYTQLFKLQLTLLEELGVLVTHLEMQEKEIYELLNAAVPYLSGRQPKPLQESCVKLFKTLATYDGDAVWLQMIKLQYYMETNKTEKNECSKNVELILNFLSETMLKF